MINITDQAEIVSILEEKDFQLVSAEPNKILFEKATEGGSYKIEIFSKDFIYVRLRKNDGYLIGRNLDTTKGLKNYLQSVILAHAE